MARVTVEDCLEVIPDRFLLVVEAAQRAREIQRNGKCNVERNNDKHTVLALREIAEGCYNLEASLVTEASQQTST